MNKRDYKRNEDKSLREEEARACGKHDERILRAQAAQQPGFHRIEESAARTPPTGTARPHYDGVSPHGRERHYNSHPADPA